jgi:hypothetical protein
VYLHRATTLGASLSERVSVCAGDRLADSAAVNADGELYAFNATVPGDRCVHRSHRAKLECLGRCVCEYVCVGLLFIFTGVSPYASTWANQGLCGEGACGV